MSIAETDGMHISKEQAELFLKQNIEGEIADDELENVTDGTCYSKGKEVVDLVFNEQRRYAIVSPLNTCPFPEVHLRCMGCDCSFRKGSYWYCNQRWWENDYEVRR